MITYLVHIKHSLFLIYRPVPLEHFLYTGNRFFFVCVDFHIRVTSLYFSKATSNELFKIVDSRSTFLTDGYKKVQFIC